jgi:3-oxoacyl-[acyl-carrier protein] reductase
MPSLSNRVAIVTGSGRGIGQKVAVRLATEGANVVVNDLDEAPAQETVRIIQGMGRRALACVGDVTQADFGDRIVDVAVHEFGGAHIVVNNAGYTWDNVIQKMTDEQWQAIMDVHVTAPFRIARAFAKYLRTAHEAEYARGESIVRKVVNISSGSGVNGNAGQVNYSSAKSAVIGMTKSLAKEWGRYRTTVNCVAFGFIETRLTQPLEADAQGTIDIQGHKIKVGIQSSRIETLNRMIPLGRAGTADEAASAVYLFCSPDSDYVSGQTLLVAGGL